MDTEMKGTYDQTLYDIKKERSVSARPSALSSNEELDPELTLAFLVVLLHQVGAKHDLLWILQ